MLQKYNFILTTALFLIVPVLLAGQVVYADNAVEGGAINNAISAIEPYIELVNLLLITVILAVSFSVSSRMGGVIKETINAIILVLALFWLKEFIAVLTAFEFMVLEGFADAIEFLMILTLLMAINKLRKLF